MLEAWSSSFFVFYCLAVMNSCPRHQGLHCHQWGQKSLSFDFCLVWLFDKSMLPAMLHGRTFAVSGESGSQLKRFLHTAHKGLLELPLSFLLILHLVSENLFKQRYIVYDSCCLDWDNTGCPCHFTVIYTWETRVSSSSSLYLTPSWALSGPKLPCCRASRRKKSCFLLDSTCISLLARALKVRHFSQDCTERIYRHDTSWYFSHYKQRRSTFSVEGTGCRYLTLGCQVGYIECTSRAYLGEVIQRKQISTPFLIRTCWISLILELKCHILVHKCLQGFHKSVLSDHPWQGISDFSKLFFRLNDWRFVLTHD